MGANSNNEGFDRLQDHLLEMQVGDVLRPMDAADRSGLAPEVCLAVLQGLERAGLMTREPDGAYVRRRLNLDATASSR